MAIGGLSGLTSGFDTSAVVDQLMALERQPQLRVERRAKQAEASQTALRDIMSRLKNLKTAGADLRAPALWANKQTVETSDATKTAVRFLSGGAAGA